MTATLPDAGIWRQPLSATNLLADFGCAQLACCGTLADMKTLFPSAIDIRASLLALNMEQIARLAKASGVPATTLMKIRYNQTKNPGIDTVRRFFPHIKLLTARGRAKG